MTRSNFAKNSLQFSSFVANVLCKKFLWAFTKVIICVIIRQVGNFRRDDGRHDRTQSDGSARMTLVTLLLLAAAVMVFYSVLSYQTATWREIEGLMFNGIRSARVDNQAEHLRMPLESRLDAILKRSPAF